MATREEITFLREARAGTVSAQLILGKYYLFGGAGLKRNETSALYWLHRAASRNEQEAWLMIGSQIPFEVAARAPDPSRFCIWYEKAFDAGVVQAALVWARLLLAQREGAAQQALPPKALAALEKAAESGLVEAQWLLAQQLKSRGPSAATPASAPAAPDSSQAPHKAVDQEALEWATRAAANGVLQAQRALADRAWSMRDYPAFLHWALPVARVLADRGAGPASAGFLAQKDAVFLSRCARECLRTGDFDPHELERFWELAAKAGDRDAGFALGLRFANMNEQGERSAGPSRNSNYRKAIHWLSLAAEQGVAAAWYALYRIFMRPNTGLSQHSLADAQRYLERAAESGHRAAQLELGRAFWRTRRRALDNDVHAAYWLRKAAAQGADEAAAALAGIATCAAPASWARQARRQMTQDALSTYPFLAARLELAALFGLSLPESLLLDINAANRGHCLLVDIRKLNARSKRRLILVESAEERLALDRIRHNFASIDCGPKGPEGNYRQRLYLFRKLFTFSEAENKAMLKCEIKFLQAPVASVSQKHNDLSPYDIHITSTCIHPANPAKPCREALKVRHPQ